MTNSALAERHDIATASTTLLHLPPDVHSLGAGQEAIELAEDVGLSLDADQRATLLAAMAETRSNRWAAAEVADFKGRQAGKNDTLKARQIAGIHLLGERLILHTAHEVPTALEDFLRLVEVYEANDELRKSVARIRYANGEQGIEFRNGARIKYKARTGSSGRGFAGVDLVVYDEAQELKPEHLAASLPTLLAAPQFQAWYSGSGGFAHSRVAWQLRRRALSGDGGRLAYTENSAQSITLDGDRIALSIPDDLLAEDVLRTHPAYANGRRGREVFETFFRALGPAEFAREFLCVWEPEPEQDEGAIPLDRWHALVDGESLPTDESLRLALDAPPDRTTATFAIAGKRDDGLAHVSIRRHVAPPEMGQLVELARQLTEYHGVSLILSPDSPALSWRFEFEAAGVPLDVLSHAEYAQACGLMASKVSEGTLRHRGIPEMVAAVAGLGVRQVGDVERWSRRSSTANIAPFVAATCALIRVAEKAEAPYDGPLVAFR